MRLQRVNMREFKYQNPTGDTEPIRDQHGNFNGEYAVAYGPVQTAKANISPATGVITETYFGADVKYDRVIALKSALGISERSRIWIDDLTAERHDYEVRRIAESLNSVLIAVSKVTNRA